MTKRYGQESSGNTQAMVLKQKNMRRKMGKVLGQSIVLIVKVKLKVLIGHLNHIGTCFWTKFQLDLLRKLV